MLHSSKFAAIKKYLVTYKYISRKLQNYASSTSVVWNLEVFKIWNMRCVPSSRSSFLESEFQDKENDNLWESEVVKLSNLRDMKGVAGTTICFTEFQIWVNVKHRYWVVNKDRAFSKLWSFSIQIILIYYCEFLRKRVILTKMNLKFYPDYRSTVLIKIK